MLWTKGASLSACRGPVKWSGPGSETQRVGSSVQPLRRGCKLRQFACGLDLSVTSCCFDAQVAGTPMADEEEAGGEQPAVLLSPIAQPLANEKLAKKVLKVVKKGESHVVLAGTRARSWVVRPPAPIIDALPSPAAATKRKSVRRGVKEVVKALRKAPGGCVDASVA